MSKINFKKLVAAKFPKTLKIICKIKKMKYKNNKINTITLMKINSNYKTSQKFKKS